MRGFHGLALGVYHFFSYFIGQKSILWNHRTARNGGKYSLLCAFEEKEVRFGECITMSAANRYQFLLN